MVATPETLAESDRVFVFGIGGGGDIVGAIPTARLTELLGTEVLLGGVAWEPVPRDVQVGPRSLAELTDIEKVAPRIARVTPNTRTVDDTTIAEAMLCSAIEDPVYVLDMSAGLEALVASLSTFCDDYDIDAVVGVDAGGDALAIGTEPGLKSPISDAVGLAALNELAVPTMLGVIGYGSDGELSGTELDRAVAALATDGGTLGAWGLTRAILTELEEILEVVDTEASAIPVAAFRGVRGTRQIRDGDRSVNITGLAPITLYFDPEAVARRSEIVPIVRAAETLDQIDEMLRDRGIQTEFQTAAERLDRR